MNKTVHIKVSAEQARRSGLDWNSRSVYFSNSQATEKFLQRVLDDIRETRGDPGKSG